ncbi:hypothetical protein V865_002749 [Kwoniella europaea PYCC6329]|uniref:Uncharacterized protein n=1 Tax=Kwoniella europaea PYCC6329 TaxID=1423913 RepID=A0AAX4KF63_9TREE
MISLFIFDFPLSLSDGTKVHEGPNLGAILLFCSIVKEILFDPSLATTQPQPPRLLDNPLLYGLLRPTSPTDTPQQFDLNWSYDMEIDSILK